MGTGKSGLYKGTYGASASVKQDTNQTAKSAVSLPSNDSQLKHIFRNKSGHLLDTPKNRGILVDLANDSSKYKGTDKYGNRWNIEIDNKGRQVWVTVQKNTITNGGRNDVHRNWDMETGLNANPKKNGTWREKK